MRRGVVVVAAGLASPSGDGGDEGGMMAQKQFALRADQIKPLATNRGGCFATRARLVHSRFRNFYTPDRSDVFAGFRTARSLQDRSEHIGRN